MVGFSLMHGGGAVLILFPPMLFVWLTIYIVVTLLALAKKRRVTKIGLIAVCTSAVLLFILWLPYGFWQRMFAGRLASGPHAAEFLSHAAAAGDIVTVKALLEHGISVDTRNRSGQSGLHAAAVQGQTAIIDYLISKGASVNAVDRMGDSPLEVSVSEKHTEAAELLERHGGKRIRGSEAQRSKAIEEIVREGIERTEPRPFAQPRAAADRPKAVGR
ncbi:MAG: hypothetical protein CVU57_31415 [Deltaproteobacteria bacterium HGW-Deltaproteobacteria-15]|jgi:hypothetical protein|nr:MAG: hypothetical protein CVU57_31415 [Deltaproteobacteria bacterium HGW-Deltaproteobacteria-15]